MFESSSQNSLLALRPDCGCPKPQLILLESRAVSFTSLLADDHGIGLMPEGVGFTKGTTLRTLAEGLIDAMFINRVLHW